MLRKCFNASLIRVTLIQIDEKRLKIDFKLFWKKIIRKDFTELSLFDNIIYN